MTAAGEAKLSWIGFQQKHRGRGWSQQEMSDHWKANKASDATTVTASTAKTIVGWLQPVQRSFHQHHVICKDANSKQDTHAVLHTPVKQHSTIYQQQPLESLQGSPAASTGRLSISPSTPSSCSSSQQQAPGRGSTSRASSGIPAHELTALRTAVKHLLSGTSGLAQQLHGVLPLDDNHWEELPCPSGLPSKHHSALHTCESKEQQQRPQDPVGAASAGCFGVTTSGLSWNGFQKACKGQGMVKAEMSAAWKQYKATGQLPGLLQQRLGAQPATDSTPPAHQQPHQQPTAPLKWATLKDWVQRASRASSRAMSRAVSRAVSRTASPIATPQPSPGADTRRRQQLQQQQQQQQQRVVNDARRKTASAVTSGADISNSKRGSVAVAAAAVADCMPAEHLLEPDSDESWAQQQGLLEQQLQEAEAEVQQHQQHSQEQPAADEQHWQRPSGAVSGAPAASDSSSSSSSSRPSASSSSAAWSSRCAGAAARGRVARELVDHGCPGLLDGFGPWMPVSLQPGRLKRLKTAVPAKPGLYEWGVRLPAGTTAVDLAAVAAAAIASRGAPAVQHVAVPDCRSGAVSSGVRTRSGAGGLGMGQSVADDAPVVCFYLGKAGTLGGRRRLQQQQVSVMAYAPTTETGAAAAAAAAAAASGETLRTRFNKYALTKAGRLGPVTEPHKDALFAQLQAAGGQLCYRWCVAAAAEPCDIERQLLERLDYAANVVNNGQRRPMLL